MRKLYASIIISMAVPLLAPSLFAQQGDRVISGVIHWNEPRQVSADEFQLDFDGAVNHDDYGALPVLSIPVSNAGMEVYSSAIILEAEFRKIELDDPEKYSDLGLVTEEPSVFLSTSWDRKRPVQWLHILPLRRSGDGNGFEKLVSYQVNLGVGPDKEPVGSPGAREFASSSVLSTGDWYRLGVAETGIYRLNRSDLEAMGIDAAAADPRQIRIYGNGNGMLDEAVAIPRPDDLMENAIYVSGEQDGSFDAGDYILFYAEGSVRIDFNPFFQKYEHQVNFYTDTTYYFLTLNAGQGMRVESEEEIPGEETHTITTFQDIAYHEEDNVNLIKSGQIWYGEIFNSQLSYDFNFDLRHADISQPVFLKANLAGRSTQSTVFNLYADGVLLESVDVPSIVLGSSIYARAITTNYKEFFASDEQLTIGVSFVKPGTTDVGWMNYLELNFIRKLVFDGGQMSFRDMRPVAPGNIAKYQIQSASGDIRIWDVTDVTSISMPRTETGQGMISFKSRADSLKEYILFDNFSFRTPTFIEKVENQDLHSLQPAGFIIITHPLFREQAGQIADFHRQKDDMSVHIVTPQQIYNEFSSGAQDVSAIRDFMKMLYDRTDLNDNPLYLLLFGDASYDFKGILPEDNNLVPAYQSRESLKMAASFVTDDYFGCLDDDEGNNGSGTVDIGIGRFPVHTVEQADEAIAKVFRYAALMQENFGPWRNSICFVGDDEDNNIHLNQAEGLAEIADSLDATFNISKVYLDAYAQLQTPSGTRYPDANAAIDNSVNTGSLIVNYTGHGGEVGWASERVLDIPAIQAYRNAHNMPAFVTATCEFSRYDDPGLISAGELVFMNPEGAGIGLFTTTRLAYSQSNYALNKRFYYEAFRIDSLTGDYPRMGDLIRVSKTPSNQNIKNFVLLGDPALMLAYPKMKVRTLEIINENEGRPADTIHAMSLVTIRGQVEDLEGERLENFNGVLYASVFDKPMTYKTRGNDPTSKVTEFLVQDKVLYKGESTVTGGEFEFSFIVPKDISYQFGEGKISYYAVDTTILLDAGGHDAVWIGGTDTLASTDSEGPEISLYLNHLDFVSGDITTPSPVLIAKLFDESGINTFGNGIGHDIVAVIDGNYQTSIALNDSFNPETDSYQGGEIRYQIGPFQNGVHSLTLKAWDVLNNSSEKTIEFQVNTGENLFISGVQTQPNPLRDGTWFVFNHNKPGVDFDVTARIFNISGQPVRILRYSFNTEQLESEPYYWNGRSDSGNELPTGLYVYILTVATGDGFFSEISQKLMICR